MGQGGAECGVDVGGPVSVVPVGNSAKIKTAFRNLSYLLFTATLPRGHFCQIFVRF